MVGIVTKVSPHSAEVRSIIDDQSNVSGMILSTSDTCIVRGDLKLMADGNYVLNNSRIIKMKSKKENRSLLPILVRSMYKEF